MLVGYLNLLPILLASYSYPICFLSYFILAQKTCHAMAFPGLCSDSWSFGCQVWVTSKTYDSSKTTPTHVLHLGFLKRLLGVKKSTDTHCELRKTGQMPIVFYWFRCILRFWNSLLSSNNPLFEKVVQANLLIANRSDTGITRFCTHSKISLQLNNF